MFDTRKTKTDERRRGGSWFFLLAALLHGAGVLAVAMFGAFVAPKVVPLDIPVIFRPPLVRGDSRDAGGKPAAAPRPKRAAATPRVPSTKDFVAPQAIPEATSVAAAENPEPIAPAINAGLNDECPTCTGHGPGRGPGEGPGTFGDPDGDPNGDPNGALDVSKFGITPVPLSQTQPVYPALALSSGRTGAVVVEIVVSPDGRVQSARLVKGAAPFDAPALQAVKTWRYQPVLFHGQPIPWRSQVTLRFQIR